MGAFFSMLAGACPTVFVEECTLPARSRCNALGRSADLLGRTGFRVRPGPDARKPELNASWGGGLRPVLFPCGGGNEPSSWEELLATEESAPDLRSARAAPQR